MEMITSKDANNNSIKSTLSRYYHISLSTGRCRLIRDKADPLFEEMQRCERERAKSLEEAKTSSKVDPDFVDWEEAQKLASGMKKSLEERSSMSENAVTNDVVNDDTSSPTAAVRKTASLRDYKIGRVAKFDQARGFGFIYRSYEDSPSPSQKHHFEDDEVLFVHRKGIAGSTLDKPLNLDPGAPVRYLVSSERESAAAASSTKTRDQAVDVSMLSDPTDVDSILPIHDPEHCSDPNDSKAAKLSNSLLSHGESWPGLKKTLQDRTIVGASLDAFGMLYGVFDGHGGSSVADILVKEMPRKLLFQFKAAQLQPTSPSVDIAAAITAAFQQVDKDILDSCERKPQLQPQGSTATIFIVNAVLCRDGRAIVLTRDHNPDDPIEKSRVEKAGGQIMLVQGVARVCTSKTKRVMQGLAMTRSIGDYFFKRPHALSIPDPDVQVSNTTSQKDCFVLLTSDGIFEKTMTNDQAIALAAERLKAEGPEGAAKVVIRNAYSQGSEDNLTCICVQFDWHDTKSLDVMLKRAKANATSAIVPIPSTAVEDDSFDMFA
ncbi:protein phosphatase 2c, putative [Perkinsus marinus ATCC 50983]|uniref:Protein phosphatase 2c, putative n=1 Tax=Perkinsus marinus (strain ATCC 50983 / TXsc) TaxID=423536 RepID=C5LS86_PERM5|nr:protein phosphatase 2c, putative [Perkinsus marinus ATCC 50983]EER00407.1 protein phosphatase 2c, putative [Perkinsus marinus ATCC 50983]|eukprot:XP_002767689.1 protein phosphatase 2c, putative [Perkinsus marinus ATCC 50983]